MKNTPLQTGIRLYARVFAILITVTGVPLVTNAQLLDNTAIAKTYVLSGEQKAESGDLVSFDAATQSFRLSTVRDDPGMFGVVVTDPAVVLRSSADGTPLVSTGEAYVSVTSINGPIAAGDDITSSIIPGKGQKASPTDNYVIGTALDSFPSTSTLSRAPLDESSVYSGVVKVFLSVGPRAGGGGRGATAFSNTGSQTFSGTGVSTPVATVIKYLVAAFVVLGTIYVAFHNFGSNMQDSIVSVGRNPLAKASIQSMVVVNTALIILITSVGLFIGLMILFVPL